MLSSDLDGPIDGMRTGHSTEIVPELRQAHQLLRGDDNRTLSGSACRADDGFGHICSRAMSVRV
jgi:hypothetical protein